MIRALIILVCLVCLVWAPWMDDGGVRRAAETTLVAFGPLPATCYDAGGKQVYDGLTVSWYPMGRLVHTCAGDFVLWMWGDVKEIGGVSKKPSEIHPVRSKALTCGAVLERTQMRRATSTESSVAPYSGVKAQKVDMSLFPEAEKDATVLTRALEKGVAFAGRFAVAETACGTNCIRYSIIDVETGLVVAHNIETEYGASYATESTLFVTNPVDRLPELSENPYETESMALTLARLSREYYRMTYDALSKTNYLVRECVESTATGYIEVEDDRIGVVDADE